mgnify:FL=1
MTKLELNVVVNGKKYNPVPILKLTSRFDLREELLSKSKRKILNLLRREATLNGFRLKILKVM